LHKVSTERSSTIRAPHPTSDWAAENKRGARAGIQAWRAAYERIALILIGGVLVLRWAILFLIVAIIAGVFGFGGIAAAATGIARLLFLVFMVLFVIALVAGRRLTSPPL
jgi:hypothetical protein